MTLKHNHKYNYIFILLNTHLYTIIQLYFLQLYFITSSYIKCNMLNASIHLHEKFDLII